jgi:hypothetical protein
MCSDVSNSKGGTVWCDFCPFVSDVLEDGEKHIEENPDHEIHTIPFLYSVKNRSAETRYVNQSIFVCFDCKQVLEGEERQGHVLKSHYVVMLTLTTPIPDVKELTTEEKEELK